MKISQKSKELISFFIKNKQINNTKQSKRTKDILTELYHDIYNAFTKLKQQGNFYNATIKRIDHSKNISKPRNFNANSFPREVRKQIDKMTIFEITYHFQVYGRNITIHFFVEENDEKLIQSCHKYIDTIFMWLCILSKYASNTCSKNLVVYFYFTSLEKSLPESSIYILDQIHINTAFTRTCQKDSEIVVFRKEEWFKVFIHETFHNFGLDFSNMNNDKLHRFILDIFNVNSEVNLYEAYAEFWAEIINALFCSFFSIKDKTDLKGFLSYSERFINFERTYSCFQLVKALNFMGLTYSDLHTNKTSIQNKRDSLYKEKTNVLSYYVIKAVLIYNYQDFLYWCKTYNSSLLQFKTTMNSQFAFYKFIEKHYKSKPMLDSIFYSEKFLTDINKKYSNKKKQNLSYILSNLRMSICELE